MPFIRQEAWLPNSGIRLVGGVTCIWKGGGILLGTGAGQLKMLLTAPGSAFGDPIYAFVARKPALNIYFHKMMSQFHLMRSIIMFQ